MKRKLNENDAPAPVAEDDVVMDDSPVAEAAALAETAVAVKEKEPKDESFVGLGLDARLLQAIAKQNYTTPTLVQRKAIPLAIVGKDVLARAKTGSGKTAAYLLPVIHSILKRKEVCPPHLFHCMWDQANWENSRSTTLQRPQHSSSSRRASSQIKSSKPLRALPPFAPVTCAA